MWILASSVVLAALVAINLWTYVRPYPKPKSLQPAQINTLVPADKVLDEVLLYADRLVVTVNDQRRWDQIADKAGRVRDLNVWAKSTYGIDYIVVANADNLLLARSREGVAKVYR